jgi:uncharacterized lipoprotein YajG
MNNTLQKDAVARPSRKLMAPLLALLGASLLAGCASGPAIPLNYAPSSVKTVSGSLTMAQFSYAPSAPGAAKQVPADVIRNTALGTLRIEKPVAVFVRDGIFAELRAMGAKMNNPARTLNGDIEEFLIDDLGGSVDWTLRIKYTLVDSGSNKVLYQAVKSSQRRTAKFANVFGALNETIKLGAEQLADDPEFVKAIQ